MFSFFKSKSKKKIFSLASTIGSKISSLLFRNKQDPYFFEKLEELFYESDLGVFVASDLTEKIRVFLKKNPKASEKDLLLLIEEEFLTILTKEAKSKDQRETENKFTTNDNDNKKQLSSHPYVILFVGVNGSGKTTSLIKLAYKYKKAGKKVLIGAADTFRAAAVEQLSQWAEKLNIPIVKGQKKSDPSAVAYDTLSAAIARDCDVVIIDTAGRLHTKTDLMQELEKIRNVCHKLIKNSPHETILTLDASIGQNAVDQATIFHKFTPIDAIFLSKLDGSAKGGIVIHIKKELNIPVKYIGIGEKEDDMKDFSPKEFIQALLSNDES